MESRKGETVSFGPTWVDSSSGLNKCFTGSYCCTHRNQKGKGEIIQKRQYRKVTEEFFLRKEINRGRERGF